MDVSSLMSKELLESELCGGKISMALLEAEARAREAVRRRKEENPWEAEEENRLEKIPLTEERKKLLFDLCVTHGFPPQPWMTKDQVEAIASSKDQVDQVEAIAAEGDQVDQVEAIAAEGVARLNL